MRFFLAIFLIVSAAALPAGTTADFPHKLELRRCQVIDSPDEADESMTCSCTVVDWIRDGEGWIAVCKN
jgi:hypothetical protein